MKPVGAKRRSQRPKTGIHIVAELDTDIGAHRVNFLFCKSKLHRADWFHEFEDDPRAINVKYAMEDQLAGQGSFISGFTGCVSCFTMTSDAPDTDYFVVGAGVAAAYRNGLQSFLMFEGLLGYENLTAYSVTIGLRGQF